MESYDKYLFKYEGYIRVILPQVKIANELLLIRHTYAQGLIFILSIFSRINIMI